MSHTYADSVPSASPVRTSLASPLIQRCGGVQCPPGACGHDDEPAIQRSAGPGSVVSAATGLPARVRQVLRSAGSPLDAPVRMGMGAWFGHDFGHVRVHTDDAAARSAAAIQAQAYTFGDHVVMGAGRWQPHTAAGRRLLAHELTHVIQQSSLRAASPSAIGDPATGAEREASALANSTTDGPGTGAAASLPGPAGGPQATWVPDAVRMGLASGGRPLDEGSRTDLGALLGHDFSRVRAHAGAGAARAADALGATAFSVGDHIVFGADRYSPGTQPGRDLIAHELTHVAQSRITGDRATAVRCNGRSGSPTTAAVPAAAVIPDGGVLAAGQMHKTEFLDRLEAELIAACHAELAPFGRSAQDCPIILRTIQRHRGLPVSAALRLIQAFAHPAPGSNARELIAAVTRRARVVARRVAERTAQERGRLQSSGDPRATDYPFREATVIRAQLSAGRPLAQDIRTSMEASFQTGFANVRVHTDESASALNRALGARAFTVGPDIAFAAGQYRPGTIDGDQLIAHELAHTIQQRSGGNPSAAAVREHDERHEREADEATRMVTGPDRGARPRLGAVGRGVQRWGLVIAGAIATAELAPEAIVIGEVGTEVVVVDGALTVTATATPAVLETAVPMAVEALTPTALEASIPLAQTTAAATTTTSAVATTLATGAALTLSSDSPEQDKRRCRSEPSPDPLPISWPAQLPYPEPLYRRLQRTPSADLEWEGIGRSEEQSFLARQIREARDRLVPPPSPCFPESADDVDPNAPYDAHHRHPLYLGGEEAAWNLCALRADRHQAGHPRLDNQSEHLPVYVEHGICSPFLRFHPPYQHYEVVATK